MAANNKNTHDLVTATKLNEKKRIEEILNTSMSRLAETDQHGHPLLVQVLTSLFAEIRLNFAAKKNEKSHNYFRLYASLSTLLKVIPNLETQEQSTDYGYDRAVVILSWLILTDELMGAYSRIELQNNPNYTVPYISDFIRSIDSLLKKRAFLEGAMQLQNLPLFNSYFWDSKLAPEQSYALIKTWLKGVNPAEVSKFLLNATFPKENSSGESSGFSLLAKAVKSNRKDIFTLLLQSCVLEDGKEILTQIASELSSSEYGKKRQLTDLLKYFIEDKNLCDVMCFLFLFDRDSLLWGKNSDTHQPLLRDGCRKMLLDIFFERVETAQQPEILEQSLRMITRLLQREYKSKNLTEKDVEFLLNLVGRAFKVLATLKMGSVKKEDIKAWIKELHAWTEAASTNDPQVKAMLQESLIPVYQDVFLGILTDNKKPIDTIKPSFLQGKLKEIKENGEKVFRVLKDAPSSESGSSSTAPREDGMGSPERTDSLSKTNSSSSLERESDEMSDEDPYVQKAADGPAGEPSAPDKALVEGAEMQDALDLSGSRVITPPYSYSAAVMNSAPLPAGVAQGYPCPIDPLYPPLSSFYDSAADEGTSARRPQRGASVSYNGQMNGNALFATPPQSPDRSEASSDEDTVTTDSQPFEWY